MYICRVWLSGYSFQVFYTGHVQDDSMRDMVYFISCGCARGVTGNPHTWKSLWVFRRRPKCTSIGKHKDHPKPHTDEDLKWNANLFHPHWSWGIRCTTSTSTLHPSPPPLRSPFSSGWAAWAGGIEIKNMFFCRRRSHARRATMLRNMIQNNACILV